VKPADIAAMIGQAEQAGTGFYVLLLRRVMQGELNACFPMRDTTMPPLYRLGKKGRPVVCLLGDDDYATTGPAGWACADKVRAWAAGAIVHGTGGQPWHYDSAADAAMQVRRLLFIETSSSGAQLWAAFLKERTPPLPFMGLLPPAPGSHPVMPAKGELH